MKTIIQSLMAKMTWIAAFLFVVAFILGATALAAPTAVDPAEKTIASRHSKSVTVALTNDTGTDSRRE